MAHRFPVFAVVVPGFLASCCAPASSPPQSAAILFVVDKSGGMAGKNIEGMREACRSAIALLRASDYVGVLAFDTVPKTVVPMSPVDQISSAADDRLRRLHADGGTRLMPALATVLQIFEALPEKDSFAVRHVVLISDGDGPKDDYREAVTKLTRAGVTVSTICVSSAQFDPGLLSEIAQWGKGRFCFTNSPTKLPQMVEAELRRALEGTR